MFNVYIKRNLKNVKKIKKNVYKRVFIQNLKNLKTFITTMLQVYSI